MHVCIWCRQVAIAERVVLLIMQSREVRFCVQRQLVVAAGIYDRPHPQQQQPLVLSSRGRGVVRVCACVCMCVCVSISAASIGSLLLASHIYIPINML